MALRAGLGSRRRRGARTLAAALLAAGLPLAGCTAAGTPQPSIAAGSTAGPSSGMTQASAPLETSQTSAKAPVYWLGRARDGVYLYREFRDADSRDNPIATALRIMMSQKPLDPHYFTPWQSPKKLAASVSGRNYITVDVSDDAFNTGVDEPTAQLAVQQLVYTATAAAASSGLVDAGQPISVMLLVDGRTSQLAFSRVQLGQLMQRDPSMIAPVWIIDPQEGTQLKGALKVFGRATQPDRPFAWQVLRHDAQGNRSVYVSGNITSGHEPGHVGEFTFSVNLPPGDYEVRILPADDASPSAASSTAAWDSKSFTITG
ncbi:GerMN domain-containing protein [Sinomonas atrocyanea]|uniref:GerMN domain-containing protein n=1 Tax=Sinomonas atrocyanea TaxID=37927 RepID=UPI00278AC691|nr:GerMN domain-containing protein [Sinomonas atrocyanea]MDQ0261277.1 spore germination protein GerM [Sinomonas atrocyanea]MDR6619789.1 spore germination protein GerM [Sinomonas atrocyanea]